MRYVLSLLSLLCLAVVFLADSPMLLGLALFGSVLFAFAAVLAFAQAKIDSTKQREVYMPSPQERELMRRAAEKRKLGASTGAGVASGAPSSNDAGDGSD